ncbi:SGNH/GDSL hydrolase family protein [Methylopila turkensis]|nr:SGNH/GDSL hydrolase family protein [Methylopila turkensis]
MRTVLVAAVACVLLMGGTLLVLEGGYAVLRGGQPAPSVTYQTLAMLGLTRSPTAGKEAAYAPFFSQAEELSDRLELMKASAVGVGNSPFRDAMSGDAAINTKIDGCPAVKPNLRKTAFFLRTNAFNPFDPPTIFHDVGKTLDPQLAAFFERYGTRPVSLSTNAQGERVTDPLIERPRKVLVAGDSVAFGAMVDDSETISSQLQKRDGARQYVNLGVAGVDAEAILCRLEDAAQRYRDQIDELVYVYCENDFQPKRPYGRPDEVIDRLRQFAAREKIGKVTVVFSPYIYMVAPELTRFSGHFGASYHYRAEERRELEQAVKAAGFRWVDIGLLAKEEEARSRTRYAIFSLFVDQNHLSPAGVGRLVDALHAN